MFIYYVYAYIRKNDGTPYYIGKGNKNRAFEKHGRVKTPKDKSKIIFLETNLSNIGACALERRYIRWYGRKNIDDNGILHNLAKGGEGGLGFQKGNRHTMFGKPGTFTGRKHKPETIEKMKKPKSKTAILAFKNRPQDTMILTCPHCNKIGDYKNMKRWHMDKCKFQSQRD
jgi:hypothetical protein